jgi:hypothetical protein
VLERLDGDADWVAEMAWPGRRDPGWWVCPCGSSCSAGCLGWIRRIVPMTRREASATGWPLPSLPADRTGSRGPTAPSLTEAIGCAPSTAASRAPPAQPVSSPDHARTR